MGSTIYLTSASMLLACCLLSSCGSSSSSSTPPIVAPDVYIAGFHGNKAAYWKNGTEVDLTDGTLPSVAAGIAVSGSTVAAAGYTLNSQGHDNAYVWINGVQTALTDGDLQTEAFSVAFSGSDIYVCGWSFTPSGTPQSNAVYWKNGTVVHLPDNSNGITSQIAISGSDIYISGWIQVTTQTGPSSYFTTDKAVYWKNGTEVDLTNAQFLAEAVSIAIDGSDVYVAGFECLSDVDNCAYPTYWKNGVATQLSQTMGYYSSGIAAADGQFWALGATTSGLPIAYQNGGVIQQLQNTDPPVTAFGAVAYGQDFYTVGTASAENGEIGLATAWKNETTIFTLSSDGASAAAFAIAVVAPPAN